MTPCASCSPKAPIPSRRAALAAALLFAGAAAAQAAEGRYRVTIENTNPGQNFSPAVLLLHDFAFRLFETGAPPSEALARLAEDGDASGFRELADAHKIPARVVVAHGAHRLERPTVSVELAGRPGQLLSVAAMLTLTNDGFAAARDVRLPEEIGASTQSVLEAYDAGSEENTESCAHVPCTTHGVRSTARAEGRVSPHPGIRGGADIPPHRGWMGRVLGSVIVERVE